MDSLKQILHQLRNCLGSIQTFLDVVNVDGEDPKLERLHQRSKENLTQIKELLKKLEVL